MVKFVSFDRSAALFVGFYSCLVAAVDYCQLQYTYCSVVISYLQLHDRKKRLSNQQAPVEEETKSLEQANDVATLLHCHVVMAPI